MVDSVSKFIFDKSMPKYMRTPAFKTFIETMMGVLTDPNTMVPLPVTPTEGNANRFDLTGFLYDNNIPLAQHYTIMRMNQMDSIHDFNETKQVIYAPSAMVFQQLCVVFESSLVR